MARKKNTSYESSIEQLEDLIRKMDSGELSLEDSLAAFEQGIGLIRECQTSLKSAELKVQQLIENQGGLDTQPLDNESE